MICSVKNRIVFVRIEASSGKGLGVFLHLFGFFNIELVML